MPEINSFSKYFTFEELTNTSHSSLLDDNREKAKKYINAGKRLSKLLESIRELLGSKPITVSSGFRSHELNKKVGGSATSGHTRFECADIVPQGDIGEVFNFIMHNKDKLPDLRKAIIERVGTKKWIHVQVKMDANSKQEFYATSDGKSYTKVG